jgi:hypothetical protein
MDLLPAYVLMLKCSNFYLGGVAEPFEGIGLIIVSIFERKGLALLAGSLVIYALEDSLGKVFYSEFTLLVVCHMCCDASAFLMIPRQGTKKKLLTGNFRALFTFHIP